MANVAAKRTPDAPRTIAAAFEDTERLQELLGELDESTLVQALVKVSESL
jgi:hypothetical protein